MTQTIPDAGKLLELAAKCEAANSADQKAIILEAWESYNPEPFRGHRSELAEHREWREGYNRLYDLLKGGAAIDAAITLIPTKGQWFFDSHHNMAEVMTYWDHPQHGPDCTAFHGEATTPALALCAAALRTRAASSEPRYREGRVMRYARIVAESIGWAVLGLALLGAISIKTKQGTVHLLQTTWSQP